MQLQTYLYTADGRWNKTPDPDLDSASTLVLVFGPSDFSNYQAVLADLKRLYPTSILTGCSTSGEIYATDIYDDSLSIAVARFDHSELRQSSYQLDAADDSIRAGSELARDLEADNLKAVFVLSDGLHVNGSSLVKGISEILGDKVIVTGGLAGDGNRFEKTWVINQGETARGVVSAVGFYGDTVRIAHGSKGGWDVLGPERKVTRSIDNVLYELDGQPALQLYKKYLGDRAQGLPSTGLLFPLSIRGDSVNDDDTVRTILSVDEDEQSITFAGNIPQDSYVKLMRANFDRLIDGASMAAEQARIDTATDRPVLCAAISCVGRRLVLGQRTEEELEAVLDNYPANVQQVGFYSYGEISPLASGKCDLHNQTMTLSLFWEE